MSGMRAPVDLSVAFMGACIFLVLLGSVALSTADEATFLGKVYATPSSVPQPIAFFPLTDGSGTQLATFPSSSYNGTCTSANAKESWWVADDTFDSVVHCTRNNSDSLLLSSVNYAETGNFSLAFWVRPDTSDLGGSLFAYLFSNSAYGIGNPHDTFAPNSINIYLPEHDHPAYGLVRAVVKDETDQDTASFLDSDGSYNSNAQRNASAIKAVTDGAWHFITVTSRLDGQRGFLLYIDGSLSAQLPPAGWQQGDFPVQRDGGAPMQLSGDIVLCSRDNTTDDRHFTGSLAHLSLFDTTLTTQHISALYQTVPLGTIAPGAVVPAASPTSASSSSVWLNQYSSSPFLQTLQGNVVTCLTNNTFSGCASGYSCAPLAPSQINSLGSNYTGLPVGVCAAPNGDSLPVNSIPTPAVYFPLSNYSTAAWPLPDQWFWNTSSSAPTTWVHDNVFGPVVSCNASQGSSLSVGPQSWGTNGPFALNLWIKQRENTGQTFQYLVSTRSKADGAIMDTDIDVYLPNELHIYLPDQQHPAYDLVRAIAKDSTNNYTSAADANFLDSDGQIGSNLPRNSARLNLTDGQWHMITLTTLPSGGQGFQLYVDGLFMAALASPQSFFHLSAGNPIYVDGNLVLCGRADLAAQRFFDGTVTQFAIFNNALTPQTIQTLYSQIYRTVSESTLEASLAHNSSVNFPPPPPQQQTTAPAESLFPTPTTTTGTASGIGLQAAPGLQPGAGAGTASPSGTQQGQAVVGGVASENGNSQQQGGSSRLSGGSIAGIIIGSLAGAAVLAGVIALAVQRVRRRRMSGVARLQEVPMPELGMGAPENRYIEDQFVVSLNSKVLEAAQRKSADI